MPFHALLHRRSFRITYERPNKGDHKPLMSNWMLSSNNSNRCSKCGNTAHCDGFTCPAKKYQCKACHKFGHFTSQCFQRKHHSQHKVRQPKAHQIHVNNLYDDPESYPSDIGSSEDSFCLQVRIQKQHSQTQQIPKLTHLITNIAYQLKQHHTRNQYLRARIDTGAEINLMPVSVYKWIYHDQDLTKLTPCNLKIGTYTMDTMKIIGTTTIYLLHPDSKKLVETTFYIASNEGSVLLSCNTSLTLGLIHSRTKLDYLPPRVKLITSKVDHLRNTKEEIQVQKQVINRQPDQHHSTQGTILPMLITTQSQILQEYPDVIEGIGKFPGLPYHIHVDPGVTPKQTPCRPIPIHLKDAFQQEISKMLQAGILVPVTQATPWINSIVLVQSKDSQGQTKLCICLDPTNLNKAMKREPYHFHTLEDISHLLADACILTVCYCKKGYWHQMLDEASSYLTMFNTKLGRYRFTVMPFWYISWINSIVLVQSKDSQGQTKLCICLDPTNLNKAMKREPYHFHTLEDISHLLADACILTVCDCKKGYWHQMLDETSSYLTMFNTKLGRYRFTVMPFGISVAGDVFQRKLDECFGHIKNLTIIADDIMVFG